MTNCRVHDSYLLQDILSRMPGKAPPGKFSDVARMRSFYREHPEITALLCVDYSVMKIAETAALEDGLFIPGDLSLTCFDAPEDEFTRQMYTHVKGEASQPKRVLLETDLCIAHSTAAPPQMACGSIAVDSARYETVESV